jgi:hypothetical protein
LHAKIDEMHAYNVSLEAKLKEPIPTSCSTCELHALKNLELAHYVDHLQDEFCFKRKREERMAKEWANKDKYHPSDGVLEPRVQMPRSKASVRTVPAWGERKVVGGAVGQATPVRPVRGTGQTGAGLAGSSSGFVPIQV